MSTQGVITQSFQIHYSAKPNGGVPIHKGCHGKVQDGKCLKCGKSVGTEQVLYENDPNKKQGGGNDRINEA
jgi:hypothetical protein